MTFFLFIFWLGCLIWLIHLKINYMKHTAICLETIYAENFIMHVHYEFELPMNSGKMVTYRSWGSTFGWPRKGKRYKVLIRKDDYNKIIGRAEYRHTIFLCILSFLCWFVEVFFCFF